MMPFDYLGKDFYLKFPNNSRTIMWALTSPCNYSCSYCCLKSPFKPKDELGMFKFYSFEKIKRFFDMNIKDTEKITHNLCGIGEPLLHPSMKELLPYLISLSSTYKVKLFTNFSKPLSYWKGLYNEFGDKISKLEIHASFHREFVDEKEYMECYHFLRSVGCAIGGNVVADKGHVDEVLSLCKRLQNHYPDYYFGISSDNRDEEERNDSLRLSESEIKTVQKLNDFIFKKFKNILVLRLLWDTFTIVKNNQFMFLPLKDYTLVPTKSMLCGLNKHIISIDINSGYVTNIFNGKQFDCLNVFKKYGNLYREEIRLNEFNQLPIICKQKRCAFTCYSSEVPKFSSDFYKKVYTKTDQNLREMMFKEYENLPYREMEFDDDQT